MTYGNGTVTSYTYHDDDALETLGHDLAGTADDVDWSYGFNAVNQLTQKTLGNGAYQYIGQNQEHRLYAQRVEPVRHSRRGELRYDASGNLTSDGTWTYSYDVENMLLTAASVSAASASYHL